MLPLFKFSVFVSENFIIFEWEFGHKFFFLYLGQGRNPPLRPGCAPEFLSKHFAEYGKEKLFLNDSSILNNLKNSKQILSSI